MDLKEGAKAPVFSLPASDGTNISLKDFLGQKVILYFYPKDSTPGCTQEACDFRDRFKDFGKSGAVVIGISADSPAFHQKFIAKQKLPFLLLSDEKKDVLKAYGVWQEKSLYGRKFMGIVRTTLVINEEGKIAKIFPKVKVQNHIQEILDFLKSL